MSNERAPTVTFLLDVLMADGWRRFVGAGECYEEALFDFADRLVAEKYPLSRSKIFGCLRDGEYWPFQMEPDE